MDIKSKEARSANMSKIRAKDTGPERYIRSALFKRKYRFRVNDKAVEGHPDLYFSRAKVAVFIHGCYWHRHEGCRFAYIPKSNVEFWLTKFENNQKRDTAVYNTLVNNHVRVLIIWECAIKKMRRDFKAHNEMMIQIENFILNSDCFFLEIQQ